MKPLTGITVLDLTRLLPGGVATHRLVEWGAEVIKIEQPGTGDYARTMAPAVFARTNSGKKSIAIDLKQPRGRELLLSMTERADVLVEGNRPGVMTRLGLSYPEVCARNPRLIYVSLTGYGQDGPYAELAGHDINYLALGGVLGLNLPVIPGIQIADLVGGSMQAELGILLALQERHHTGKGQHVDVSMYAGVVSLLTVPLAIHAETGKEVRTGGERLSGAYACYEIYQCSDGRWVAVGALEPKFWAELCKRLGCEELVPLQYTEGEQQAAVKAKLAGIFQTKPASQWFEDLRNSDCCLTLVRTIGEVAADLPAHTGPPPPRLGEHSRAILEGWGYSAADLDDLRHTGVIA
jgi:crotonobetainyl-CoA:carnitine CoA-transferase CaiB-like acyl-CoA transferase